VHTINGESTTGRLFDDVIRFVSSTATCMLECTRLRGLTHAQGGDTLPPTRVGSSSSSNSTANARLTSSPSSSIATVPLDVTVDEPSSAADTLQAPLSPVGSSGSSHEPLQAPLSPVGSSGSTEGYASETRVLTTGAGGDDSASPEPSSPTTRRTITRVVSISSVMPNVQIVKRRVSRCPLQAKQTVNPRKRNTRNFL
jgi:hypothetical protein